MVNTAISSELRALRASPSDTLAKCSTASGAASHFKCPKPRSSSSRARSIKRAISSCEIGSSSKICDRETSGELTKKNGLCVVAPIRRTVPFSTSGRSVSCCDLLNRCISSMNSSVVAPELPSRLTAVAKTRRMSATLDSTPLNRSKRLLVWLAII